MVYGLVNFVFVDKCRKIWKNHKRVVAETGTSECSAAVCSRKGGDDNMMFSDVLNLLSLIVEVVTLCYLVFHKKK